MEQGCILLPSRGYCMCHERKANSEFPWDEFLKRHHKSGSYNLFAKPASYKRYFSAVYIGEEVLFFKIFNFCWSTKTQKLQVFPWKQWFPTFLKNWKILILYKIKSTKNTVCSRRIRTLTKICFYLKIHNF